MQVKIEFSKSIKHSPTLTKSLPFNLKLISYISQKDGPLKSSRFELKQIEDISWWNLADVFKLEVGPVIN